MKLLVPVLVLALTGCATTGGDAGRQAQSREALQVWSEFVTLLRTGDFPPEKIKPYREEFRSPVVGFLNTMRRKADWKEWLNHPETFRVGEQVHFLLPLTFDGQTDTYCFSFVLEDDRWYFQHLEAITLRMDRLGPLPASRFPDLPEKAKAWMREEIEVTREVWLFNALSAEKGAAAVLDWFKDGTGYALAARAWVPFVPPSRAFILYLCWEQANLRGNEVVLEQLDDASALVRLRPLYFQLYKDSAHLKQQIQPDAYRALFESRWRDRASAAGWNLDISYQAGDCVFRFARLPRTN